MHKSLQLIIPLTLLSGLSLQAQTPAPPRLDGHWEGVIVASPAEMEVDVEIDIARAGEGFQGRLVYPIQGETHEIQGLQLRGQTVSFSVVDEQKVADFFAGTISQNGVEIAGKMTENMQVCPFTFRRREPRPTEEDFLAPV